MLGFDQLPAAFMHRPVVAMRQEHHILEVGIAAVAPVHHVVGVNPQM
jgi:hypothetical protein